MKNQKIATLALLCYIIQLFTVRIGHSYTFNGYELRDINDDSTFVADAAKWTASVKRTTDVWSQCGTTYLLGGYGVLGTATAQSGEYYRRVYTGLPVHSMIHYTITFWAIDSWDQGDGDTFYLRFDSTQVDGWVMSLYWFTQQICGSMNAQWNEAPNIRIFGSVAHSASSLTFDVVSHLNEESQNESFGFRDIVFVFDQSGTVTSNNMCGSASSVALPSNVCQCSEGQYMSGSTCTNCNSLCKSCYGGSASQCYECATTGNVFWDGEACVTCAAGCSVCSGPAVTQCSKCASGYSYFAWINQCVVDCQYPLVKGTDASGNYICTSPCSNSQYIYWDRSCSDTCASPLQQRTLYGVVKLCRYPCSPVEYLFWDGTCQHDCWSPLTVRVDKGAQYCDYKCSALQYLYWDGTCGSTCPAPFKTRTRNGKQFCHPPCELSYYLYPDGTCESTCTGSWTPTTASTGVQYCNFNCGDSQFYYWDGRCLSSCDFPLQTRYEHGKAYCDYPTDVNNYLYWDGTNAIACNSPLSPRTEGTPLRKYCDFGCSVWDYMYWNGDCDEECNFPLKPRIQNGRKFCDFGCANSGDYLYWNGTCDPGCDSPFVQNPSRSRKFCDSPPTTPSSGGLGTTAPTLFYYWDGSSETDCSSPLTQRIEGTTQYCDYKCTNALEYLYWNGSCIVGCDSPLTQDTQKGKQLCNYKCDASEFLHTNGSCLSICDSPYVAKTYGSNKFCFDACSTSTDFYYWNNTCHPDCLAPLQQRTLGSLVWCIYPCLTNQFLLNDGSCIETCELPLSMKTEAGYKYCTNPCSTGEYLFYNGTCVPSCDAPLRVKDGNLCILPCDSQVEYYDEPTGTCKKECTSPSKNHDDLYLRCLAPVVVIDYGTLLDVFLESPEDGASTLVAVPSGLQYVRYLDVQMPARLANFSSSKGRSILSLRFGQKMTDDMKSMFTKQRTLSTGSYQPSSNFIVNFWEEITSLTIMITAAMFLSIFEQIFKVREWNNLQSICEKLRIITRWNFCLVLIATSVGNIVYFSSLEFRSWSTSSSLSALSIELCIIMIGVIIALLVAVVFLAHRLQIVKRKSMIYKSREDFDKFQTEWQGYQILFRGFRSTTLLNQIFFLIYVVRHGLPMIVAAYLTASPVAQTILYILINLAILIYVLHQKPLIRRINHIQLLIVETITLVMNCSLFGLAILDSNNSNNSHLIAALGDLVIGTNSFINFVAIVFLALKVIDGIRTIYKYQKTNKLQDKTVYLQLLVFFVQQGGMGFEEMFISEEAAKMFYQPDKLLPDKTTQVEPDMKSLLKKKPHFETPTTPTGSEEPKPSGFSKFLSKFKGPKSAIQTEQKEFNPVADNTKGDNTSSSLLKTHMMKSLVSKAKFGTDNSFGAVPTIAFAEMSAHQGEDASVIKIHNGGLTMPFDESTPKNFKTAKMEEEEEEHFQEKSDENKNANEQQEAQNVEEKYDEKEESSEGSEEQAEKEEKEEEQDA